MEEFDIAARGYFHKTKRIFYLPINVLGREAALKPHTARRTMQKLITNGILRPYPIINHFILGKFEIGLYVTILNTNETKSMPFQKIEGLAETAAITNLGGRFSHCIDLIVADPFPLARLGLFFGEGKNYKIINQEVVIRTKRTIFQRKFFSDRRIRRPYVSFETSIRHETVDRDEEKLLQAVSDKPEVSLAEYAARLGYTPAGIAHKLTTLRKRGILLARAYAVIALKLNLFVYRVLLSTRSLSKQASEDFNRFCADDLSTVTLTQCIGAWNYEIRTEFLQSDGVSEFRSQLEKMLGENIQKIEIIPFLGTSYMSSYSP